MKRVLPCLTMCLPLCYCSDDSAGTTDAAATDAAATDAALTAGPGVEDRCVELGASCICSEPLDTTGFTQVLIGFDVNWDPDDSPPATACRGYDGTPGASVRTSDSVQPVTVAEVDMPEGNTVTYVWRDPANAVAGLASGLFGMPSADDGNSVHPDTRRICMRHYLRHSADWEDVGEGICDNHKYTNFSGFNGTGHRQLDWNTVDYSEFGFLVMPTTTRTLDPQVDCKETWCRFEICLSGNLNLGTDIYAEGYVQQLPPGDTNHKIEWTRTFLGDSQGHLTPSNSTGLFEIINTYRNQPCLGTRDLSHAMQAEWTTDAGQFIGAAYEIEGR